MPKEQETKKSKKKKEVEIDPEILEAQRQARMKAEEIATYGVSLNFVTVERQHTLAANVDLGRILGRK